MLLSRVTHHLTKTCLVPGVGTRCLVGTEQCTCRADAFQSQIRALSTVATVDFGLLSERTLEICLYGSEYLPLWSLNKIYSKGLRSTPPSTDLYQGSEMTSMRPRQAWLVLTSVCLSLLNVKRWLKKSSCSASFFFFFNHFPPRFIDSKGIRNLSLWACQICLCVLVLFCFAESFQIEENLNVSRRTYL